MSLLTNETLKNLAAIKKADAKSGAYVKIGMSTCGIAAGADEVFAVFADEAGKRNLNLRVLKCGCIGACHAEPLVEVGVEGMPTVLYGRVGKDTAVKILDKHISGKTIVQDYVFEGILRR